MSKKGEQIKFPQAVKDKWLLLYRKCRRVCQTCEALHLSYEVYRTAMRSDPEFAYLKHQIDQMSLEVTRSKLEESAHGYEYDEVKEEEHMDKTGVVRVLKTVTRKHVPPNPTSLMFKLCNEDPQNYRNINKVELKGRIDGEETVTHNIGLDAASVSELAKAIVKAKAGAGK